METNLQVNISESALLILHYANCLLKPEGKLADAGMPAQMQKHKCIEHTAATLKASRDAGMTVIYVNVAFRPGFPEIVEKACPLLDSCKEIGAFIRGTWDAEVIDELKPLQSEIIIFNYDTSAFSHTELDIILRAGGIKHLLIAGQTTNYIIDSTTRYGTELGYKITILEDCCADYTDEMHDMAMTQILPRLATISKSTDFVAALAKR